MKIERLLSVLLLFTVFFSCEKGDDYEYYNLATPVVMTADEMRKAVHIEPPQFIKESGKIYAYQQYIFVNDKNIGVHVIDNSNPETPKKIAYINIPGNTDISVKDDFLYANSFVDLVIFDISNIDEIKVENRLVDIFPYHYSQSLPEDVDEVAWERLNSQSAFVVDWVITKERRLTSDREIFTDREVILMNAATATGTGGSMARFKIVDSYLYVVDFHNIHVFDITTSGTAIKLESVFAGFDIETIFNKENWLFLGSKSGMYIYDITKPSSPRFVSEFQHGTACDPVVVDDKYAYITLRAGNSCGAFDSSLQIVDISNIAKPVLTVSYPMDGPYGLGIKDELLFICDGASGLKVFDKSDVKNLKLLNQFEGIDTYDVIPLNESLLLIGDEVLYQYSYTNNSIKLLSTLELN